MSQIPLYFNGVPIKQQKDRMNEYLKAEISNSKRLDRACQDYYRDNVQPQDTTTKLTNSEIIGDIILLKAMFRKDLQTVMDDENEINAVVADPNFNSLDNLKIIVQIFPQIKHQLLQGSNQQRFISAWFMIDYLKRYSAYWMKTSGIPNVSNPTPIATLADLAGRNRGDQNSSGAALYEPSEGSSNAGPGTSDGSGSSFSDDSFAPSLPTGVTKVIPKPPSHSHPFDFEHPKDPKAPKTPKAPSTPAPFVPPVDLNEAFNDESDELPGGYPTENDLAILDNMTDTPRNKELVGMFIQNFKLAPKDSTGDISKYVNSHSMDEIRPEIYNRLENTSSSGPGKLPKKNTKSDTPYDTRSKIAIKPEPDFSLPSAPPKTGGVTSIDERNAEIQSRVKSITQKVTLQKICEREGIDYTKAEPIGSLRTKVVEVLCSKGPEYELKPPGTHGRTVGMGFHNLAEEPKVKKTVKYGRGLTGVEKQSPYIEFGKFVLHKPQMLEHSILNVKYKTNLGPTGDITRQAISRDLANFILDTIDGQKVNQLWYQKLTPNEQGLFDQLIRRAGLNSILPYNKPVKESIGAGLTNAATNVTDEKQRFILLKGEVCAGNDSHVVIKEFKQLLMKFINEKKIDKAEGYKILSML